MSNHEATATARHAVLARNVIIGGVTVPAGTSVRVVKSQITSHGPRVQIAAVGPGKTWVHPSAIAGAAKARLRAHAAHLSR
jgi:hypothetical protein